VIAVRLQIRRRAAIRASHIAATVETLVGDSATFWPPIFNAFDQLRIDWWESAWHDMKEELQDAEDVGPKGALAALVDVMTETAMDVGQLTQGQRADRTMIIGETPPPTALLSKWRILLVVLNQDVPVPAGLASLETCMTQLHAMRIKAHAGSESVFLTPSDPSLRNYHVTARSYGALVGLLANGVSQVLEGVMGDLGLRPRSTNWG
jgi:hypothetical protein